MTKTLKLIALIFFACSVAGAQTVISNVYVQSSTATTATIVWTTSTAATSQVKYGFSATSIPFANSTNFSLVTSHSMTLTLLTPAQPYYFAVVSTDASGIPAQSTTQEFALCGQPVVPVTGTVNFAYGGGSYTLTYNPPAGSSGPYTICGQAITSPVTGTLNFSGSFNAIVADALKVTPGPGSWTVAVNGAGNIGAISINTILAAQNQDVTPQLQAAAAPVGLTPVTATATTCNPAWICVSSGSIINPGGSYAIPGYPSASGKTLSPSNITFDSSLSNLLFPSGGSITIPGCTGKAVAADGTGCITPGSNPGGSPLQLQYNLNGTTFGGASGISTDAATQSKLYDTSNIASGQPVIDIRHTSFAGGAICDGGNLTTGSISNGSTTLTLASGTGISNGDYIVVGGAGPNGNPLLTTVSSGGGTTTLTLAASASTTVSNANVGHYIDAALQAAWNALPSTGGDINIVGGASLPTACFWVNPTPYNVSTNPTGFTWPVKNGPITLHIQGFLRTDTTFYIPQGTQLNLFGMSGNNGVNFQSAGQTARIGEWVTSGSDHGTLGTNVGTTTGSITSGTNSLSVADGTDFANGTTIYVFGAGSATVQTNTNVLQTTVSSGGGVAGPTTLTLANNAVNTVSNAVVNVIDGTQVTKAVALSSMTNVYPDTGITISGSCVATIGTITRTTNKVTANVTWAPNCMIPGAASITVAGVTDSSFNGTFTLQSSDYVNNLMYWNQTAANSSSSGGTATGFNEAVSESVICSATTSTTCTATFYRPHSSADQWGMVGTILDNNTASSFFKDIYFSGGGAQLWLHQTYVTRLQNIGAQTSTFAAGQPYVVPMDMTFGNFVVCDHCTFPTGPQPWAVHLYGSYNAGYTANGPFWMEHGFMGAGIKADHGGGTVTVIDSVVEHAARGIVQYDPNFSTWNGNAFQAKLDYTGAQDNGSYPTCLLYVLFPSSGPSLNYARAGGQIQCAANNNMQGRIIGDFSNSNFSNPLEPEQRGVIGTRNDGISFSGEVRGTNAKMAPAVVPYATANITTNPASWSTGACTLSSSTAIAPDGSATAGALTTASGANGFTIGNTGSITPAVGDMILFGGWVYTPTPQMFAVGGGGGEAFEIDTNSSTHFQIGYTAGQILSFGQALSNQWDSQLSNDGWHPVVGYAEVTQSDGTSGQQIRIQLGCNSTKTLEYWQPFLMYIPASAGIAKPEVMRWRQDLLHGAVPANYNGPGIPATNDPIAAKGYYNLNPSGGAPNKIIPSYVTGFLGNTSGVDIPFAIPWTTPTVLTSVCHDTNGNITDNGCPSGGGGSSSVPGWLNFLGDGSEAAPTCTSGCTLGDGEHWYASFNCPSGQVCSTNFSGNTAQPLIIRSTGTCTIAGTLSLSVNSGGWGGIASSTTWGGCGGGGGFGAANGAAGSSCVPGGAGSGGTSGNAGGAGNTVPTYNQKMLISNSPSGFLNTSSGTAQIGGGPGGQGGSSGGAGGKGGGMVVVDCATINFTGTIDVSGSNGSAGGANTGGGGGGGGGIVILRSPSLTNTGTINTNGGTGGAAGSGTSTAGGNGAAGWSKTFSN